MESLMTFKEFYDELVVQVNLRHKMAQERLWEYDGEDPVQSLVLSDRQRGTMEGRIETWEFMKRLLPDVEKLVTERKQHENIQTES